MKYFLILGTEFKRYKKTANIHVSLNERLIDSFGMKRDQGTIDMLKHVEKTWYEKFNRNHWIERDDWLSIWKKHPKFFKVYQVDEKDLINKDGATGTLEIKVDNSQSNYTNGFMTKSSMIKFSIIGLVPEPLLQNNGEGLMRVATKFDDAWDKCLGRRNIQPGKVVGTMSTEEHDMWKVSRPTWPSVFNYHVQRDGESETHEKSGLRTRCDWIGGSFTLQVPIKIKHKIKVLGSIGTADHGFFTGLPECIALATCKPLLNIYNED